MQYHITVKGKVQGVWFRKYTQEKALALGLTGYVCNQADGTVYIVSKGERSACDQLVEWCHQGSPKSNVLEVEVTTADEQDFKDFEIRR